MVEEKVLIEEIPVSTYSLSHVLEIPDLNNKVGIEVSEPEVTCQQSSIKDLDEENVVREYCNNYESEDYKDSVEAKIDVEEEHSVTPNNFCLILEGEDYVEAEPMKGDHSSDEMLKDLSKNLYAFVDEQDNFVDLVSNTESCQQALTLVDTEQGPTFTETLSYMPEPIKVTIDENLLDVFKVNRSKDFASEISSDSLYENESERKLENLHILSKTPVKKIKRTDPEDLTNTVLRIRTPEISDEQKLDLNELQTSSSEGMSLLIKPPTPRRSIRRTAKIPDNTNYSALQLPTTPKRGRKAKNNPDDSGTTLATLQEEQAITITRISRKKKSFVSDEPQSTESERLTEKSAPMLLSSPAKTRRGKAAALDDPINIRDTVDLKVATGTRITRSKAVQGCENEPNLEAKPLAITPSRERRGKHVVNELIKHFELGVSQASNESDSTPPLSPKRISLRWSRVRSENQIDKKTADEDIVTAKEAIAETPPKITKKTVHKEVSSVAAEERRTTRLTRTRANNVPIPDATVEFAFSTPTRRRRNAKGLFL
ncbi:hypothetical protein GDO78_013689 [Eleutherodactylus coqui]|nr:hypothetical protein GDO78_013689 [Eleutherodactylus coqui]KAG9462633.1 hypothetical protein GDO78_013689 [Eleutherodactylus coqui]